MSWSYRQAAVMGRFLFGATITTRMRKPSKISERMKAWFAYEGFAVVVGGHHGGKHWRYGVLLDCW